MVATGADKRRSYDGDYMREGRMAEGIVLRWLRGHPYILGVEDLTAYRPMQKADVDLSIQLTDGRVTLAEIKSDRHLGVSGNMLFEILRINHTCSTEHSCVLGWSARSPAQWLLYWAPSVSQLFQISFVDFRKALQAYTQQARKTSKIRYVETDQLKSTINILIPWEYVKEDCAVHNLLPTETKYMEVTDARH